MFDCNAMFAGPTLDEVSAKAIEAGDWTVKNGAIVLDHVVKYADQGLDQVRLGFAKLGASLPGLGDQVHVYWVELCDLVKKLGLAVKEGSQDLVK